MEVWKWERKRKVQRFRKFDIRYRQFLDEEEQGALSSRSYRCCSQLSTPRTSSIADCLLEGCFGFGPYSTVICTWGQHVDLLFLKKSRVAILIGNRKTRKLSDRSWTTAERPSQ